MEKIAKGDPFAGGFNFYDFVARLVQKVGDGFPAEEVEVLRGGKKMPVFLLKAGPSGGDIAGLKNNEAVFF